ncbi:unnamed protein product [Nippostrongylus brasiliensis]|uniref:Uncharacterized protein n=1 Tax=Nippostrongylus brasiliensis TaxID=27835 RepID=A0A0N4YB28_NIPBR|nr:unnamed protein product [Nippostrongylus brasiliensis]
MGSCIVQHITSKNICHRPKGRKQAVFDEDLLNDAISLYDWRVAEDPTEDYELLLKGLRTCADAASLSLSSRNASIPSNTKALLEKRRSLKMDPNATHLKRLVMIPSGIQLRRPHPKCRDGHRGLSGVPSAPRLNLGRLRKGL